MLLSDCGALHCWRSTPPLPPIKEAAAAGWLVIPVTAVPLPGVTGLAGYEVGGSLVLHPLSKSQQDPGVVIPGVRSRPAGGTGGLRRMRSQHKSQSSWFLFLLFFLPRTTRPHCSYLTRPGSSPRRHSAGCTWASSARRRRSGCSTDQELNQGDLEAGGGGGGAVGEREERRRRHGGLLLLILVL